MQILFERYEISLSEPTLMSHLIERGRYTSNAVHIDDFVIQPFPVRKARIIQFFEGASANEANDQLIEESFRQATFEELLCFGSNFSDAGRDVWIAASGTVLQNWNDGTYVPMLRCSPVAWQLGYWRLESGFEGRVCMLAIANDVE